jgi:hypothetical protein
MTSELRRIERRHVLFVVIATTVALAAGRPGVGGVLLGGGVMLLSVTAYEALFGVVVRGGRRRLAIGLLFGKLAALLGLGWVAFASRSESPDPLGFALGVTCFPAAVVWSAVQRKKA